MKRFNSGLLRQALLLFFSLLLAFGTGGRAFGASATKNQAPPNSGNMQAWLTQEVHHQLVMLPYFSVFDNLEYKVEGNTVTLIGQVVRGDVKSDAEKAVKKIEGVEQVNNQIEILPASSFDDQIRHAEFRAIYSDANLQRYAEQNVPPIHIIVKNSRVTLEGVVATEQDKQVAEMRAKGVPNVFAVTDNLRVDGGR